MISDDVTDAFKKYSTKRVVVRSLLALVGLNIFFLILSVIFDYNFLLLLFIAGPLAYFYIVHLETKQHEMDALLFWDPKNR